MSQRTDIHRPSAIKPDDYVWYGDWPFPRSGDEMMGKIMFEEREFVRKRMEKEGLHFARHEKGGSCDVCGANAIYLVVFHHTPSKECIKVGCDCAMKFELGDGNAFRTAMKEGLELKAGKRKAEALLNTQYGMPGLWKLLEQEDGFNIQMDRPVFNYVRPLCFKDEGDFDHYEWKSGEFNRELKKWKGSFGKQFAWKLNQAEGDESTIRDMVGNLVKYGSWSEKQVAYAKTLMIRLTTWEMQARDSQAKYEEENKNRADAPVGREPIEGEVISVKEHGGGYGYYDDVTYKMTVKDKTGWMGWCTVPQGIHDAEKGDIVRLTATWTPSDDDKKFAFGKRPSKAEYIEKKETA